MSYNGGYRYVGVPDTQRAIQQNSDPLALIVGLDSVFTTALNRNIGFVQIMYSAEELVEYAVHAYIAQQERRPCGEPCRYANQWYAGSQDDKDLFEELLMQLTTQIDNNIRTAYERSNVRSPITGYAYKDEMLFIQLG